MACDGAFSQLAREGRPMTLLLIDLDLFKTFNDVNGHQAGDDLLSWVGRELHRNLRPCDAVARLGGDEFVVLLEGTGQEAAEQVIERVEAALGFRAQHCLGRASAPDDGSTFDDLYRVADTDLYRCKQLDRPARAVALIVAD